MELSLGKIKSIFKKEKQQDILYVLATILIIGVIAGLFIWSISIVFKAVDAAFFVNQKDINEDILNGTATKGLATDWKEKFAAAGFKAENIKTGNADNKNYSGIAIYHNAAEGALAKITDVFSQNSISTKTEIDLKLDGISFIIIIGK